MNNTQKKTRFNFIDVVILLIVLAIIGAAIYLVATDLAATNASRQTANMTFTVRLSALEGDALSLIADGVTVKDSANGNVIGTIIAVSTERTKYYGSVPVFEDGIYTIPVSEYPDKFDVYVTIRTEAGMDSRGIPYVGSNKLLVGAPIFFKVPSFTAVTYITDVKPMQNA